ncbi:ferredoxin [Nocardia jiangxiensis]|uniref:ferredoxin n=1 Tax=Nocardia jiangxiensis TaxID=282685 RepID=UPI0035716433
MKVTIDHTVCTGHGMCYGNAPEVFADDEQDTVRSSRKVKCRIGSPSRHDRALSGVRNERSSSRTDSAVRTRQRMLPISGRHRAPPYTLSCTAGPLVVAPMSRSGRCR